MEIERKYLIRTLPEHLEQYPHHLIEQAYLCTEPVVRIRRQDDEYILTYKGKGMLVREEYNLPLNASAYAHLLEKADGNSITIKLDIFEGKFQGLTLVEVEFPDEAAAEAFSAPEWFGEEVTWSSAYHNSTLSSLKDWPPTV